MSDQFTADTTGPDYGSVKTLTLLTFIGSAIAFISAIWNFINAEKAVSDFEKNMANPDLPDFAKKMMTPEVLEAVRLSAANKIPLLIINLLSVGLCVFGAIEMRKLKQQGYFLWLIGEVLPVLGGYIFLGNAMFVGGITTYIAYGIFLLFILLYTLQLKYLTVK